MSSHYHIDCRCSPLGRAIPETDGGLGGRGMLKGLGAARRLMGMPCVFRECFGTNDPTLRTIFTGAQSGTHQSVGGAAVRVEGLGRFSVTLWLCVEIEAWTDEHS